MIVGKAPRTKSKPMNLFDDFVGAGELRVGS